MLRQVDRGVAGLGVAGNPPQPAGVSSKQSAAESLQPAHRQFPPSLI
ncbi:hypothetical protein [Kamptonema formosum]|nr:hypothetical protein [Oscillatoria sp. PCC 10802]